MARKLTLLALICVLFTSNSFAQENYGNVLGSDRPAWIDKVYVGGGVGGISFSKNQTYVNLSVMGGYHITEKWNTGVAVNYIYQKIDDNFYNFTRKGLGWNIFSQYTIYDPFFIMARYDIYTIWQEGQSRTLDAVLLGGGVNQPIGGRGFMSIYALYNVVHSTDPYENLYSSPWVLGINFGFGF